MSQQHQQHQSTFPNIKQHRHACYLCFITAYNCIGCTICYALITKNTRFKHWFINESIITSGTFSHVCLAVSGVNCDVIKSHITMVTGWCVTFELKLKQNCSCSPKIVDNGCNKLLLSVEVYLGERTGHVLQVYGGDLVYQKLVCFTILNSEIPKIISIYMWCNRLSSS